MMDASKGFIKAGNKNRLREQDIHKIVDTFTRQAELPRYSRLVPVSEIADPKNDYNLNLPRYIDSTEPEDLQDIDAHLRGGIPNRDLDALADYWQVIPGVRTALFKRADRAGYSQPKLFTTSTKSPFTGISRELRPCFRTGSALRLPRLCSRSWQRWRGPSERPWLNGSSQA